MTSTQDRVAVHLKLDRPIRQKVVGTLHLHGSTMQAFYERWMQSLAKYPERIPALLASFEQEDATLSLSND